MYAIFSISIQSALNFVNTDPIGKRTYANDILGDVHTCSTFTKQNMFLLLSQNTAKTIVSW